MNVVATARGALVEVQATAEGEAVPREDIDRMVDLALAGDPVPRRSSSGAPSRRGRRSREPLRRGRSRVDDRRP
jgi:hypothetical protein